MVDRTAVGDLPGRALRHTLSGARRRFGHAATGMGVLVTALRATHLLAQPVLVDGIRLGHVVDVIFDVRLAQALGLEVRCGDGEHRFLPLAAAHLHAGEIAVSSPLALLDTPELAFYALRGASFRALRTMPSHGLAAPVVDVELDDSGAVERIQAAGAA